MKCEEVSRLLSSYMVGILPEEVASSVEDHLSGCITCTELLLPCDEVLDSLLTSDWHLVTPPPLLVEKVMARVEHKLPLTWLWVGVVWSGYLSLWAVGLLSLIFSNKLPGVALIVPRIVGVSRSVINVIKVIFRALQLYSINSTGLLVVFVFTLLVFLGFAYISKEELA